MADAKQLKPFYWIDLEKIHNRYFNENSKFWFMNLLLVLGILGIIPFIINSFFVNPAADDFLFANTSIANGAWQAQVNWYTGWTGRYFSTFILCNSPLVYGWMPGYKLFPLLLLGLLFLSIYILIRSLSFKYLSKKTILVFTLVILFIYLHRFPSPTWGLYWMTGAITYQLANIATLFLLSALVQILKSKNTIQKTMFTIVGSALVFIAVGCNEISMILINALLVTVFIVDFSIRKKINFHLLWLILFALSLSVFVFVSPGKGARETAWPESGQFIASILATFRRTLSQVVYRLIWSPLLIFSFIAFPMLNRLGTLFVHKKVPLFNVNPLVAIFWLMFLPALFFPLHYSLGPNEPHAERVTNIAFLFFIFTWFYFEILVITYIKRNKKLPLPTGKIPIVVWWLLLIFYGFFPLREHNKIRTAYENLISGESYMHNKMMNERIKYLSSSDCTNCPTPEIPYFPETIVYKWFYNTNNDFWMNRQAARYWGKKGFIIEKNQPANRDKNKPPR